MVDLQSRQVLASVTALGGMCCPWRVSLRGDASYKVGSWACVKPAEGTNGERSSLCPGGVLSLRGDPLFQHGSDGCVNPTENTNCKCRVA